jgi:undecaprenyl-diphosphatase
MRGPSSGDFLRILAFGYDTSSVTLAGAALIVFVGSSRALLQVHYLSDIIAGYACGAVWVGGCIAALEAMRWRGQTSASCG